MAEPTDQASNLPAAPNAQLASKSENSSILDKSEPSTATSNASWTAVLNAMQLAEDAVSKAVQGMADHQVSLPEHNQK